MCMLQDCTLAQLSLRLKYANLAKDEAEDRNIELEKTLHSTRISRHVIRSHKTIVNGQVVEEDRSEERD